MLSYVLRCTPKSAGKETPVMQRPGFEQRKATTSPSSLGVMVHSIGTIRDAFPATISSRFAPLVSASRPQASVSVTPATS